MQCPIDQTEMIHRELDGAQIEECSQCKGIWFDKDEFREAKDSAEPDLVWMDFDIWKHEDQFNLDLRGLHCPKDGQTLVTFQYGETQVEIDLCTQCQGIWLDRGEFEKIIAALDVDADTKSASEYMASSLSEAKELITGEEKFSSEWRDLSNVFRLFQYRAMTEHNGLSKALYFLQRTGMGLAGYNVDV
jgi:Zn-finger nucleic acid-binding protein